MPSIPSIKITDKEDGSGVLVDVSGSDSGTTNTFKTILASDRFGGSTTFVNQDSIVDDGQMDVSLAKGFYFGKVESANGGSPVETDIKFFSVTNSNVDASEPDGDDILTRVIDASHARIFRFSFNGFSDPNRVYKFAKLDENVGRNMTMPCIMVSYGLSTAEVGGSNARDDSEIPINISAINRKSASANPGRVNQQFRWISKLKRGFRAVTLLNGASEVYNSRVDPVQIWDTRIREYDMFLTGFNVNFIARESREIPDG